MQSSKFNVIARTERMFLHETVRAFVKSGESLSMTGESFVSQCHAFVIILMDVQRLMPAVRYNSIQSLGLQPPPEKVVRPPKLTLTTFSGGGWSPRECSFAHGFSR